MLKSGLIRRLINRRKMLYKLLGKKGFTGKKYIIRAAEQLKLSQTVTIQHFIELV